MSDPQHLDHMGALSRRGRVGGSPGAEIQVPRHGQMREQPGILKDMADTPPARRQIEPRIAVENRPVIDHDAPMVRSKKSGYRIDACGFSGPGRAEKRGQPGARDLEFHLQAEARETVIYRGA